MEYHREQPHHSDKRRKPFEPFFARKQVPNHIRNGDFLALYSDYLNNANYELGNAKLLVQLNHPNQNGGRTGFNYGRNRFNSDSEFVDRFKDIYMGIEHINNHDNSNSNEDENNDHRNGEDLEKFYKKYLNMGFRLGPIGDHDNHRKNWGRHTAARTGVWATSLTPAGFAAAYKARRVYATEDNELALLFKCGNTWMGSYRTISGETEVTFTIRASQYEDMDSGELQDEGPYEFEIIADLDGPGGQEARPIPFKLGNQTVTEASVAQGIQVQVKATMWPRAYAYLHVRETNGIDANGNEGEAWTAPIFFRS